MGKFTQNFRLPFSGCLLTKCSSLHIAVALVVQYSVLFSSATSSPSTPKMADFLSEFQTSCAVTVAIPQAKASKWETVPVPSSVLNPLQNIPASVYSQGPSGSWNFPVAQFIIICREIGVLQMDSTTLEAEFSLSLFFKNWKTSRITSLVPHGQKHKNIFRDRS